MTKGWHTRWSVENEERLRSLWNEGMSATLIAMEMGYSRSGVLAKVGRMKLGPHEIKTKKAHPRAGRVKAVKVKPKKPVPQIMTKAELRAMLHQAVLNTGGTHAA